ncbi:unnamed protein product [Rotaria sp. Silwood1]|nr:unnamed protein product [Rotaria sp. Silwood1]CAF1614729.1 unnamed protein product [Rotaria sp. Silwood1]
MVLFYGLLAFETANNTIAATRSTTSQRTSKIRKQKSIEKISSSSTNSWIYTEDLRKHFEKRYIDYRFVFVPVYVNQNNLYHNSNTKDILTQKNPKENSWMYSKSIRDHLFYSTSKISLPLTTNISSSLSSVYYINNQAYIIHHKSQIEKNSKKNISLSKNKLTTSLSSIFTPNNSSLSLINTTNNLTKFHTNDIVQEEDENNQNENNLVPLINKHPSMNSACITVEPSNDNKNFLNTTNNNKSNTKQTNTHNNRLTRLRSFFFKSSSSLSSTQQTTLPSSSLHN